jgi:hypothetical protein
MKISMSLVFAVLSGSVDSYTSDPLPTSEGIIAGLFQLPI